jgi:hypothetical protein
MEVVNFIKTYWVQILFILGLLGAMYKFAKAMLEATKCSLRNDILSIYDRCKDTKKITKYQLESIEYSYKQYKALKGNSFVDAIYKKVHEFELID